MAGEEELTQENVRTEVLNEVALRHPIVVDDFNLCDHRRPKLTFRESEELIFYLLLMRSAAHEL